MTLTGVGIDVIEIRVVERMLNELGDRFLQLALRPSELARLPEPPGRPMFVSRHLAAKEAAMKALGLGLGPSTSWRSFELEETEHRSRLTWISTEGRQVTFHVAISRSADTVIATAWAEEDAACATE